MKFFLSSNAQDALMKGENKVNARFLCRFLSDENENKENIVLLHTFFRNIYAIVIKMLLFFVKIIYYRVLVS